MSRHLIVPLLVRCLYHSTGLSPAHWAYHHTVHLPFLIWGPLLFSTCFSTLPFLITISSVWHYPRPFHLELSFCHHLDHGHPVCFLYDFLFDMIGFNIYVLEIPTLGKLSLVFHDTTSILAIANYTGLLPILHIFRLIVIVLQTQLSLS